MHKKNTPFFNELKLILFSIYEGLEIMGDIQESDKDYFLITTEKDMQECFDFLEERCNFILDSEDEIEISLK